MNKLELQGQLTERQALRYTPAGVPVCEARLVHESEQVEASLVRKVALEINVIALGDQARWLQAAPLGQTMTLTGFLAAKSKNSKTPVLHVQKIEFLEGK